CLSSVWKRRQRSSLRRQHWAHAIGFDGRAVLSAEQLVQMIAPGAEEAPQLFLFGWRQAGENLVQLLVMAEQNALHELPARGRPRLCRPPAAALLCFARDATGDACRMTGSAGSRRSIRPVALGGRMSSRSLNSLGRKAVSPACSARYRVRSTPHFGPLMPKRA